MYPRPRSWSETWPSSCLDLEPLDLLLDAVGDELLDAAVAGGFGRALRPVEQAGFDLDLDHERLLHADGELSRGKTFFPTICGGVGSPNSARIDGARSTSDGGRAARWRLQKSTPGTSRASAQWSALQAWSLASRTSSVRSPSVVAQDAR